MHSTPQTLSRQPARLIKAALLTGAVALALTGAPGSHASSGLCASGDCAIDAAVSQQQASRYTTALQRSDSRADTTLRPGLSDQDLTQFSGIGVVACSVGDTLRSSTAFLVGAFDIGVTVAHTFQPDASGAVPTDCVYTSMDARGQIRERIAVAYVHSQWQTQSGAAGDPTKDFAVLRLSKPSRYAQRTLPLGRFSGTAAQVVMIGYKADIAADTAKQKARGTVYDRGHPGKLLASLGGFAHDMDSADIAAGAPVIDESSGVIIGIHTRLPAQRNAMIPMNDWLEATLRREIQYPGAHGSDAPAAARR